MLALAFPHRITEYFELEGTHKDYRIPGITTFSHLTPLLHESGLSFSNCEGKVAKGKKPQESSIMLSIIKREDATEIAFLFPLLPLSTHAFLSGKGSARG